MSEERAPTKNSQIFIARLHPSVNEKDLKYKFQKFGEIKDVRLKPGYAFIDYEKPEDAEEAIDKMDGKEMEGQKIVVQISKRIYKDRGSRNGDRGRGREDRDGSMSRKRGPQLNDTCFNCGKSGHWANECRDPIKPRRDFRERDNLTCYKCGGKGHKQKFCSERRTRNRSNSRGRNYRRERSRSRSSSRSGRSRSRSSSRDRSRRHRRRSPIRSRSTSSYSSRSPRRDNKISKKDEN